MITAAIIALILLILFFGFYLLLQQPQFGLAATGERLERMRQSPNYRNGKFHNLSYTPTLAEGHSMRKVLYNFLFKKVEKRKPVRAIQVVQTDLSALPADKDLLVWFGHSSYLLRLDGKTFLADPVLNHYAAPFSGMNKAFAGTDHYTAEDMPFIDYLLITHDHYDHLDYHTTRKLTGKTGTVITGLGVGAHLERWGFNASQIIEKDWWDVVELGNGFSLHYTPARHFSGRKLQRNTTLWTSFVLKTPRKQLFLGGDSGYDTHFATIGEKFGGFDLAILENGQYNEAWHYIHTLPAEVLQAGKELKAQRIFPVHAAKFDLGGHPWDEPLERITVLNNEQQALITPRIGEVVYLDDSHGFSQWWRD